MKSWHYFLPTVVLGALVVLVGYSNWRLRSDSRESLAERDQRIYELIVETARKSQRIATLKTDLKVKDRRLERLTAALVKTEPVMELGAHQFAVEYIAHACFRVHSAGGKRVVIDPYASRADFVRYDFPDWLTADAVLITHPHYDHDAGESIGRTFPWEPRVPVLRTPGDYAVGDIKIQGIRGKHAGQYGRSFGHANTIWLLEIAGVRIAHLGDNGPLTKQNVEQLGRVDVLMIPIDTTEHLLKNSEIELIRAALQPRILIPMHYFIPELDPSPDDWPKLNLGPIDPWLAGQENVARLKTHLKILSAETLPEKSQIVVLHHSPQVHRPHDAPNGANPPNPAPSLSGPSEP